MKVSAFVGVSGTDGFTSGTGFNGELLPGTCTFGGGSCGGEVSRLDPEKYSESEEDLLGASECEIACLTAWLSRDLKLNLGGGTPCNG